MSTLQITYQKQCSKNEAQEEYKVDVFLQENLEILNGFRLKGKGSRLDVRKKVFYEEGFYEVGKHAAGF